SNVLCECQGTIRGKPSHEKQSHASKALLAHSSLHCHIASFSARCSCLPSCWGRLLRARNRSWGSCPGCNEGLCETDVLCCVPKRQSVDARRYPGRCYHGNRQGRHDLQHITGWSGPSHRQSPAGDRPEGAKSYLGREPADCRS